MKTFLIKLSGEILGERGFDREKVAFFAREISTIKSAKIAIVIGGGNLWRGRDATDFGFLPADSDAIGMNATILNAAILRNFLQKIGKKARVFSPFPVDRLSEKYSPDAAKAALKAGEIIFCAGGTGAPFFTTDSAAVLRALEIGADAVLKGTKVDGIFSADPMKNPDATRFSKISFSDALDKNLKIMDATAFALARENKMPIFVFNAFSKNALSDAISGKISGSWVG